MKTLGTTRILRSLAIGAFALALITATTALASVDYGLPRWFLTSLLIVSLLAAGSGGCLLLAKSGQVTVMRHDLRVWNQAVDGLQQRLRDFANQQGRFVGNIAHELKTPLTNAIGQLDLLARSSADPAMTQVYCRSITADLQHLADMVDSFLRLARPFAQEDTSHHTPVFFHDVVVEAVRRCRSLAQTSDVAVVLTLAEAGNGEAALEVSGDAVLLEAMIENLVRNAIRFSPQGSRVEVSVLARPATVVLRVRDHGMGIPPENLVSVFDWFFKSPELVPSGSGHGFGLAIARRVAEHHGGSITISNRPEGGCEFEIVLPRWIAADAAVGSGR